MAGKMTVMELERKIKSNERPYMLDVREPFERDICKLTDDKNIPLKELEARLEELDKKYSLITPQTKTVLDIGCAPGSRLQYISRKVAGRGKAQVIGFDIKAVEVNLPHVETFVQDVTGRDAVKKILDDAGIEKFDLIVSDMAPDTGSQAYVDAMRSIALIRKTRWLYDTYLAPEGKFAIKIFM